MLPGELPVPLYRGDTYVIEGVLHRMTGTDGQGDPIYEVVDLTGHALAAQVRIKEDADLLASFVAEIDGDPTLGGFRLTLTAEESAKVFRNCRWDFETTALDGTVTTWLQGPVELTKDTTREESA